jgi:hypothetical protein
MRSTSGRDPDRHRAALAVAYRAELDLMDSDPSVLADACRRASFVITYFGEMPAAHVHGATEAIGILLESLARDAERLPMATVATVLSGQQRAAPLARFAFRPHWNAWWLPGPGPILTYLM